MQTAAGLSDRIYGTRVQEKQKEIDTNPVKWVENSNAASVYLSDSAAAG